LVATRNSSWKIVTMSRVTTTVRTKVLPGGVIEHTTETSTFSEAAPAGPPAVLSKVAPEGQAVVTLQSGAVLPAVGLGTWKAEPGVVKAAVTQAIKLGYRHIDCACDYGNEGEVGEGIRDAIAAGICTRADLWVTSKLWNTYHAAEHVEMACKRTLADLGLDYLDLYLIHFPISLKYVPFEKRYPPEWVPDPESADPAERKMQVVHVPRTETWGAMERLKEMGLCREIGVSNHTCQTLIDMLSWCKYPPAVNQIEIHPYLAQDSLVTFCKDAGIAVTGFSPLGAASYSWLDKEVQQNILGDPALKEIAAKHGKSVAQVCLRWQVQRGLTVVPKSVNPERQAQNLDTNWELTEEDMAKIFALNKNIRYNDPADFTKGFGLPHGYPIYA